MDSVTQFLLGAGVASLGLGPKLGARALLIGGVVATLPDLDSFLPFVSPLDGVTYHRGFSHSLFVQTALSPLIAYGIYRWFKMPELSWMRVLITVWLCLITHSLLDSLTTYGTQLMWPFEVGPPVALPSIFIIDPVYTLLLAVGAIGFLILARHRRLNAVRFSRWCLMFATLYLGIGVIGHFVVKSRAMNLSELQHMRVHVQPTPFTILYWQVLAVDEHKAYAGVTRLFSSCSLIDLQKFDRQARTPQFSGALPADVKRFEWFTDGFFTYRKLGTGLIISDLRIGFFPFYHFSFQFAKQVDGAFQRHPVHWVQQKRRGLDDLKKLYKMGQTTPQGC